MNSSHVQDEELELYALGSLDAGECGPLRAHLEVCPECRQRLAAARGRVHLVALAAGWREPPQDAREKLLRRVRSEAAPDFSQAQSKQSRRWPWQQAALAWGLAALVLAAGAAFLLRENRRLERELAAVQAAMREQQAAAEHLRKIADVITARDTQRVALAPEEQPKVITRGLHPPEKPHPDGHVLYNPHMGLLFNASKLPAPPAGRAYQLWLVPMEGAPVSAGVFMPDNRGDAEITMPPLPPGLPAKEFAVTLEPEGGMASPTGPKVLVGKAS